MSEYIRKAQCRICGEPNWFRYWVGQYCSRSITGLAVQDYDLLFHRFKNVNDNLGSRRVEDMMVVEVKTGTEPMRAAQRDSLSVFNGLLIDMIPMDGTPINVRSRPGFIVNGDKKVTWHGVHLLRIPVEREDSGPFYWDNKAIAAGQLARVLSFEADPNKPDRALDISRRHKAAKELPLFGGS